MDPFDQNEDDRLLELIKKAGLEYLMDGKSKQELADKEKKDEEDAKKGNLMADLDSESEEKEKSDDASKTTTDEQASSDK